MEKPGASGHNPSKGAPYLIGTATLFFSFSPCGICGSDLHTETGVHDSYPPVTLGHEYTGVTDKVGKNVTRFKPGDPVSLYRGPKPFPGLHTDGGFAEYLKMPADCMWKTPEGITPEEASQFETVLTPASLVRDVMCMRSGERVVVSGPGQIGLLTTNYARIDGASHITVLGAPGDEKVRLPLALEMGADEVALFGEEALEKLKGDNAPSCWFEASGAARAIEAAVDAVTRGGRVTVSGLGEGPWNVNMWRVARDSIKILGRWGGAARHLEDAVALIREGRLKMGATISEVMPLTAWKAAFGKLRRQEAIKILLDPSR